MLARRQAETPHWPVTNSYHAQSIAHPCSRQLNLFLAVLKIKFAKAQSLLVDKRKGAKSTERLSSIMRLVKWATGR